MAQITKTGTGGAIMISDSDDYTAYETIAELRSWSLDESSDVVECTNMSSNQIRKYLATHKSWTGTMDVYQAFDDSTGNHQYTSDGGQVVPVIAVGSTYKFKFYVDNSTTTFAHYDGEGIVTGISRSVAHDGIAEMTISVQGTTAALAEGA
jgi:hypothetical protein